MPFEISLNNYRYRLLYEYLKWCLHPRLHCPSSGVSFIQRKTVQTVQNAAARLLFNQRKRAHVTLLLIDLLWLPMAAQSNSSHYCLPTEWLLALLPFAWTHTGFRSFSTTAILQGSRKSKSQSRLVLFMVPWWSGLECPYLHESLEDPSDSPSS